MPISSATWISTHSSWQETPTGTTLVSITIEDFLFITFTQLLVYSFYALLNTIQNVKNLGFPLNSIEWTVTFLRSGAITLSKPTIAHSTYQINILSYISHTIIRIISAHLPRMTSNIPPQKRKTFGGIFAIFLDITRPDLCLNR